MTNASATRPSRTTAWVTLAIVAAVVVAIPIVLFSLGEDLFGSDDATIDDYNHTVLSSCELPADTTLVRIVIAPVADSTGATYRSMAHVFASPQTVDGLAEALELDVGYEQTLPTPCDLDQRPGAWVMPIEPVMDPDDPSFTSFWGAGDSTIEMSAEVPADTRSLVRLRLAQRVEDGLLP